MEVEGFEPSLKDHTSAALPLSNIPITLQT